MARGPRTWQKLDWYPLELDALLSDTDCQEMSPAQFGWYCRLWISEYRYEEKGEGLPDNVVLLGRIVGGAIPGDPEWEDFVGRILDRKFPLGKDGTRHNPKVVAVFHEQQNRRELASIRAREAANARWSQTEEPSDLTYNGIAPGNAQGSASDDAYEMPDKRTAEARSTTESSEPRPNGLVSPDSAAPAATGWKAGAAQALRAAHVPDAEIGDAITNFWGVVRERLATDAELMHFVAEYGRKWPRGWNPARYFNVRNGDRSLAFERELNSWRKHQPTQVGAVLQTLATHGPAP